MVGRRVVIVRHGERVDFTFTDDWIQNCFSDDNTYIKNNLNMPDTVPQRSSPRSFLRDCPLTKVGELQASVLGQGLVEERVLQEDFVVYVSPALRCVQTALNIAKGMGQEFTMSVEPGLFEWTGWFRDFMPTFMTVNEYLDNGYPVNPHYLPYMKELKQDEELDECYNRSYFLMQHLLNATDKDILIVAHGISLDTLTRQITGGSIRSLNDMMNILRSVPYCACAVMELDQKTSKWGLPTIPRLTMKHTGCHDFEAFKALKQDPKRALQNSNQNPSPSAVGHT